MSAGARTLTVAPRFERSSSTASRDDSRERKWLRLVAFAALALYAVVRWSTLLRPAPTARLIGLLVLAVAMAAAVPWLRRRGPVTPVVLALALVVLVLPVAGLPWQWFVHDRIAVSARHIGDGLSSLPNVVVPYGGAGQAVRLVITLGAGVLLLDAAAVMAFAPAEFGDLRRAAVVLPLIAMAIVPSTLVRPQLPYLQGLVLFGLLAAFQWGDRVRRDAVGAALAVSAVIGVGAAIAAPRLDLHKPWVNYRAWAGSLGRRRVDAFNWNQTYGPLRWPRSGHLVLTVRARQGDYWKAQDLDLFNGYAWVQGSQTALLPPADPGRKELTRWSQSIGVTIQGMRTDDVIAAGVAGPPAIAGGASPGTDPGAWVAANELGPGATYTVRTYSPHPSAAEMTAAAGRPYPVQALGAYLTLSVPAVGISPTNFSQVTFPPFHSAGRPTITAGDYVSHTTQLIQSSPYGAAYVLARQLAARAATPYAFVASVQRYLSQGFRYNENPPLRAYPLESFLFKDRIGYCQQFSGAMALLLRMGGVPARVAAGFTAGTFDSVSSDWAVSDINAHAWDEVWFPRYGWVRFDPTPATAPARAGPAAPAIEKRLPGAGAGFPNAGGRQANSTPSAVTSTRHATRGGTGAVPEIAAGVLAALLGVGLGWMLLRPPLDDGQLLTELERALARSGRPLAGGVTLAALERRFRDSPGAEQYVRSLRLARYGGIGARPTAAQRRALREQLRFGLGLRGRLRAWWALPPRPGMSSRRRADGLRS